MTNTRDEEYLQRVMVKDLIEEIGRQTNKIIYLSPAQMHEELKKKKVYVSLNFVYRRYYEMNINTQNGLWFKELE